jgi:hypothetical protein
MQCARHPKVETALSCSRCATPICPDCMVSGAVGMLCRDCASLGKSPLYQVRPERFALALIAGLAAGTVVGLVLQHIGYFIFFVAPVIGGFLGEVILRATGRKRGPRVEFLAGLSVLGGAALSCLVGHRYLALIADPVQAVFFVVAVALVLGAAFTRIRYI